MPGEPISIGGFSIRNTNAATMTRFLQARIARDQKVAIGFANHHFVTACQSLPCSERDAKSLVLLNDGIGMQMAALLRFGRGFAENMNGTDFVPRFLRAAGRPYTVFLIGSRPTVVGRAAETISNLPNCQVIGFCDGFSLWQHEDSVLAEISRLRPDVLLVGLGNPLQERWIVDHWAALDAKVIIGVGALFDWMTGLRRRAPKAVRAARLEWAYRIVLEPRRLLRRYTVDGVKFFSLVFRADPALAQRDGLS